MRLLSNLRIPGKILLVLAMFAALCAALVALSTYHVSSLAGITQNVVFHTMENLRLAHVGQQHILRLHQLAFQLNDSEMPDKIYEEVEVERERMMGDLETLRELLDAEDTEPCVSEIATSAKEQAAGLHEINSAIEQMDRVTQQNTSMVEESTAASFGLASEAQALADMIAKFKIGDAPAHGATAPKPAQRPAQKAQAVSVARSGAATARKLEPAKEGWEEF